MENQQLSKLVDHTDPRAILAEIKKIYTETYTAQSFSRIENAFEITLQLFNGHYRNYTACNTEYHNLSHTLDATIACTRLMDGRNLSERPFTEELASDLIIATLLHDSGYIQQRSDKTGTGAKYTSNHVERSMDFVRNNMEDFLLDGKTCDRVGILIACTGLKNRWEDIKFTDSDHMSAGTLLATADLLGQMSDRAYLEKLLFLYYEFREAGIPGFNTEFDILRKTLDFYEITQSRLDVELRGAYRYAGVHFNARSGIKSNLYMDAIERHMDYLKQILADETTNFRHKLKRLDLESVDTRFRGN